MTAALDRPDWIQGITSYLSGRQLYNESGQAAPISVTGIDLHAVGTIYATPDIDVTSPSTNMGRMNITWYFGTTVVSVDEFDFWGSALYQATRQTPIFTIPTKGDGMDITVTSYDGTGTASLVLWGVSQVMPTETVSSQTGTIRGTLANARNTSVAAGSTDTYYIPPTHDGYWLSLTVDTKTIEVKIVAVTNDGAEINTAPVYNNTLADGVAIQSAVLAPNLACIVQVINSGTAATDYSLTVSALP